MATIYIKFNTPAGVVFGIEENGVLRSANSSEVTKIISNAVPVVTRTSSTDQPISAPTVSTAKPEPSLAGIPGVNPDAYTPEQERLFISLMLSGKNVNDAARESRSGGGLPSGVSMYSGVLPSGRTGGAPAAAPAPATTTPTSPTGAVGAAVGNPVSSNMQFKSSAAYGALSQEMKDFVDLAFNLISVGGEEEAKFFANAISQAQAIADPYFKTQIALAKAEITGAIAEKNFDYGVKSEAITRARDELLQDISLNKEFLTFEQQADIAKAVKGYDEDLLKIADEAAEKGITFATGARSRALAESRRGEQFQDVVQSNRRRFNFQMKELELKASRGDTAAQKELEKLQGERGFSLQQIGRAAEEVLGSAGAPSIPGYAPTGGAMGKIEEDKRRAIISDTQGFMQLQKGFL